MPRSAAVELAPGVFRIPTAPSATINSFVLRDSEGVTLVDCGLKRGPGHIVRALKEIGSDPSEVTRIIVTHAHPDHVAGLAAFAARSGARVAAHEREAPYLRRGRAPSRDGSYLGSRAVATLSRRFAPTEISDEVSDQDVLPVAGGVRVLHTPGHTPGHISLLHLESGTLIVGDALVNIGKLRFAPACFCTDAQLTRKTATVLAELDYEIAAFSHGTAIAANAQKELRSLLEQQHEVAP